MKKFAKIIAMVLLVFIMGSCAGSFALFNRVNPAIANLGGKFIGQIVWWISWIVPIFPICFTVDFLLLNTIEWWTGNNLISYGNTLEQVDSEGNILIATKNQDGSLSMKVIEVSGNVNEVKLERNGNEFIMYDAEGVLISSLQLSYEDLAN